MTTTSPSTATRRCPSARHSCKFTASGGSPVGGRGRKRCGCNAGGVGRSAARNESPVAYQDTDALSGTESPQGRNGGGARLPSEKRKLRCKKYGTDGTPHRSFFHSGCCAGKVSGSNGVPAPKAERGWQALFDRYAGGRFPAEAAEFRRAAARQLPSRLGEIWASSLPTFDPAEQHGDAGTQGKLLDALCRSSRWLIGRFCDSQRHRISTRPKSAVDSPPRSGPGRYILTACAGTCDTPSMNGIAAERYACRTADVLCLVTILRRRSAWRVVGVSERSLSSRTKGIGLGEDGRHHQPRWGTAVHGGGWSISPRSRAMRGLRYSVSRHGVAEFHNSL